MNSKVYKYRIAAENFEIIVVQDEKSRIYQAYQKTSRMKYFQPLKIFGVWLVAEELEDIIGDIHGAAHCMVMENKSRKKPIIKIPVKSFIYVGQGGQSQKSPKGRNQNA